ncbi:hypothetical protein CBR_g37728 [Chara braunii]|uniref:Uncharacterized protein n=1 Tax=Chara braunii TaxID=69332 RepID=A0A388JZX5_CHABU|nr:hypothetical protein CBR_g37728 [Chara braunii]|eukprot:GBG63370.1 hypothetical protein CBR_g37728 [Chara braunii]
MDKQGKLMAMTVDSASKRQCLVLMRQCDILEREVEVQPCGRGGVDDVRREDGKRDGRREGNDVDDRPLANRRKRTAKEVNLEERSKLWVDCDTFWGQGPEKPLREVIGDCTDDFIVIANLDTRVEPPSMLIMPPNDVPRFKIDDPVQHEPALRKVRIVEKLVMCTIHNWIFKSSSRSNGFARAESYITVDYATNVA